MVEAELSQDAKLTSIMKKARAAMGRESSSMSLKDLR